MSTLKVSTLQNLSGTEVYTCKAWVNFNGTGTVAIRASGNVSSITDGGTGYYTVNFTTALPDSNYSMTSMSTVAGDATKGAVCLSGGYNTGATLKTTTQVIIRTGSTAALNYADFEEINLAIFR
jgi:hypothetical protein